MTSRNTTHHMAAGWRERVLSVLLIVGWAVVGLIIASLMFGLGAAAILIGGVRRGWHDARRSDTNARATVIEGQYRVLNEQRDTQRGGDHG